MTKLYSVTTKLTKCSLFQTPWELSVNRKDLRALILVGPTRDNPVPDPLAVLHLDNRLSMYQEIKSWEFFAL